MQHPKLEEMVAQESEILVEFAAVPKSLVLGDSLVLSDRHRKVVEQRSGRASLTRRTVSFLHSKESYRPRKLVEQTEKIRTVVLENQKDLE